MPTGPMRTTWLRTPMPNSSSRQRQIPAIAVRVTVSRADERSSTGRTSSKPYLITPAMSAWPGRRRVTLRTSSSTGFSSMMVVQLGLSALRTSSEIGEPMLRPWRTPDRISTVSVSICIRPPRP